MLANGSDEESADDDYYEAKYAHREWYEVTVTMAMERPKRFLKGNNKFRRGEWSDAESLCHNPLAQAEEDYQNAVTIPVKACRRGDA